MNLYEPMKDEDRPFFSSKMLACPLRGHFISFQLVDELGDGKIMARRVWRRTVPFTCGPNQEVL